MHSSNARKISRQSIGVIRARSFRTNVPIAKDQCIQSNQQQHRVNVPAQTPSDYYKRAVAIPLLDHLQSEMKTYFNPTNDAALSSLFNLLPELVAVGDRNPDIEAALEFYENGLPSPHVVDVEFLRWKRKWCSTEDAVQFRHSQHAIESSFLTSTP